MYSPPPTPTTDMPQTAANGRFRETGYPCEWSEMYRPGGFHPVHFGDTFKDAQYRVIRKLGYGSFSTVWLAVDSHNSRYIALKIMMAKASAFTNTEVSIYNLLAQSASTHPLSKHVNLLLDSFDHTGPNGTHRCLVFAAMGATAASMVEELPGNQPYMWGVTYRYPKAIAKKILKHALSGLVFLHENGVVHGDFQSGNLLFGTRDLQTIDEKVLHQNMDQASQSLERLDGKVDLWAPKYLALGQSLHEYVNLGPDLIIKVSDLGAAFWVSNPPDKTVTPLGLRAPELIFKQPFGSSIDIWSFGCLIYEFLTGQSLFTVCAMNEDEDDEADDDHILDLNDIIQPIPDCWLEKWPRAAKYFGPNRERLNPAKSESGPFINDTLEVRFEKEKPDDIDVEEAKEITMLIRLILQYEPKDRPSAKKLLEHPWFKTI